MHFKVPLQSIHKPRLPNMGKDLPQVLAQRCSSLHTVYNVHVGVLDAPWRCLYAPSNILTRFMGLPYSCDLCFFANLVTLAFCTQVLTRVDWYTDRVVSNISLGSVMVMMLVRTIQTNIAHIRVSLLPQNFWQCSIMFIVVSLSHTHTHTRTL